tara:strand:- start:308 stop:580 length:273 start_codon:yes stop_codon:yes gene_type:complete
MNIIKEYLLNKIEEIKERIYNLNINNINNKLYEKKIEYINFYINNIIIELDEINDINKNNLFKNKEYTENELLKYKNMEKLIVNYTTHNL